MARREASDLATTLLVVDKASNIQGSLHTPMSIQLLVSVRDAAEAAVASQAGVDIIDVKEPSQGPLGFAGVDAITSVLSAVSDVAKVSAALGECSEWPTEALGVANATKGFQTALSYVKLGLAGMAGLLNEAVVTAAPGVVGPDVSTAAGSVDRTRASQINSRWSERWQQVRNSCLFDLPVNDQTAWVGVAYSDAVRAHSPPVAEVLRAAADTNCAVFLLDTFVKDGKTTLDWLSQDELIGLRELANAAGMKFALAGQLTFQHLPIVGEIQPDIFAVRGAVCEDSERRRSISGDRIRLLQTQLAKL